MHPAEKGPLHKITVNGRSVRFTYSPEAGVRVCDAKGRLQRQPVSPSDPFWGPFEAWLSAGGAIR